MKTLRITLSLLLLTSSALPLQSAEPIKALLITGGGSHDYEHQKTILTEGISARANVVWTIADEGEHDKVPKDHLATTYYKPDWSKGYDVIVHDECYGGVTNVDFVEKVAKGHASGVPAVVLHATIHSYRLAKTDDWRQVLGVSSFRHQAARPFKVINLKPEIPIMKGFPAAWQEYSDEVYEIVKFWPNCVPLAKGFGTNNVGESGHLGEHLPRRPRFRHHHRPRQQDRRRPGLSGSRHSRPALGLRQTGRRRQAKARLRPAKITPCTVAASRQSAANFDEYLDRIG